MEENKTMNDQRLYRKISLTVPLELLTGLYIGSSNDAVEIGGVDRLVVRRRDNNQPYIPGSSLKGKMRCLLEQVLGENPDGKSKNTGSIVSELFGASEKDKHKLPSCPSRLIVRDSFMTKDSVIKWQDSEFTDLPYTEVKMENTIDRLKGTAGNPRKTERVPAGVVFEIKIVINLFHKPEASEAQLEAQQKEYLETLEAGFRLLEQDYLGGSGSRGYGQIEIQREKGKLQVAHYKINSGAVEVAPQETQTYTPTTEPIKLRKGIA